MAIQNLKLKVLHVYKILLENTDENHIMSAAKIAEELEKHQLASDRRSIYNDIDSLIAFGVDVRVKKGNEHGYYIGRREFSMAELKLLIDAVSVSRSITESQTRELIDKLLKLGGKTKEKELLHPVYRMDRSKAIDSAITTSVNEIHQAIMEGLQIRFQYTELSTKKLREECDQGRCRHVTPLALFWDEERYLLAAYEGQADAIQYYRVDRMQHITITQTLEVVPAEDFIFDPSVYRRKTFFDENGREELVTLRCHRILAGTMVDQFGWNIQMKEESGGVYFQVALSIVVGPRFFGWLLSLGQDVEIIKSERTRREFFIYLQEVQKMYQ